MFIIDWTIIASHQMVYFKGWLTWKHKGVIMIDVSDDCFFFLFMLDVVKKIKKCNFE